jgi:hypothetical protein
MEDVKSISSFHSPVHSISQQLAYNQIASSCSNSSSHVSVRVPSNGHTSGSDWEDSDVDDCVSAPIRIDKSPSSRSSCRSVRLLDSSGDEVSDDSMAQHTTKRHVHGADRDRGRRSGPTSERERDPKFSEKRFKNYQNMGQLLKQQRQKQIENDDDEH